mgnify:CR=1 FL=1
MDAERHSDRSPEQAGKINLFREYRFFWVTVGVVLIDQLVKLTVKINMLLWEEIPVLGQTFRINFFENKGAAFGLTIADLLARIWIFLCESSA